MLWGAAEAATGTCGFDQRVPLSTGGLPATAELEEAGVVVTVCVERLLDLEQIIQARCIGLLGDIGPVDLQLAAASPGKFDAEVGVRLGAAGRQADDAMQGF